MEQGVQMNSYERVIRAIQKKQPDRVPIVEFVIDPVVYKSIMPDAKDVADFSARIGLDAVQCGARYMRLHESVDTYVDEWGVTYKRSSQVVDHPLKGPITSLQDLRSYQPPDPHHPDRLGQLPELVERYKGEKAIIFHHRAAFMWSAYLLGLDNLLAAFILDPQLVEAVMDMVAEINEVIVRRAVRAGADIIVLGDDYAGNNGPLMSPSLFERFILPRLKRFVDAIHEEGGYCVKHSDGNIEPILDMIVSTGVDGLNPLEPVAGMDIAAVKKRYGKHVCLIGNIDCTQLLPHGTPEEVRRVVKKCIEDAAYDGGFMLSSSNSIHAAVAPENYLAMIEAGKEFGVYN